VPGQSFVCERDGLVRIDVKLAANDAMPAGGLVLRLFEDDPGGRELARASVPGDWTYGPRRFLPLRLEQPMALAGQRLRFTVEAAEGGSSPPLLLAGEGDELDGGALQIDGSPVSSDLVFRTWHQDRLAR